VASRGAGDDPRPTVLHVLEAIVGGTARHLVDLVEHSHGARHVVAVPRTRPGFYPDRTAVQRLRAAGADVHFVDMRRSPTHPANLIALGRLAALQRRAAADVVHGHSAVGGALARLLPGSAARVYTPNGLHPSAAARAIERRLVRRTDRFVAVSASEGALAVERGLARPDQVVVIPNGVDPNGAAEPVDLHELIGVQANAPLVGTIARLDAQKAPLFTMTVFERLAAAVPEIHFVLIGDGPLAGDVDALGASGALAGRFHRIPGLPVASAALASLRVFLLLSAYEGGPYAPLEAARAGVPLVLTDVVGNRDVAVPGESGELVPLDDTAAAAAAVLRLLDDGPRRERAVTMMTDRLRSVFSLTANGRAHDGLYVELAQHRHALHAGAVPYPHVPNTTTSEGARS
jgi:glycosyltransferase involved in cell wall biosynthesis